jgi:branched-chain amino acid transport system permease protein
MIQARKMPQLDTRLKWIIGIAVGVALLLVYLNSGAIKAPTFVRFLINGLVESAILFLMASGLSLIFGLMDVVNFAHGAIFTWGGFAFVWSFNNLTTPANTGQPHAFSWLQMGLDPIPGAIAALIFGLVTGALLGAAVEFLAIRRLYGRPVFQILLTLGLVLVLDEALRIVFNLSAPTYDFNNTPISGGFRPTSDILVNWKSLIIVAIGLLVFLGIFWLLNRTKIGLVIRGGVEDTQMVQALGYNVKMYFFGVFVLGSALAALGGMAYTVSSNSASEGMGQLSLLTAFVVVVIGGMGSFTGAAIGALMVGMLNPFVGYHFSAIADSFVMILLVIVLLVRPNGLFGASHK